MWFLDTTAPPVTPDRMGGLRVGPWKQKSQDSQTTSEQAVKHGWWAERAEANKGQIFVHKKGRQKQKI